MKDLDAEYDRLSREYARLAEEAGKASEACGAFAMSFIVSAAIGVFIVLPLTMIWWALT